MAIDYFIKWVEPESYSKLRARGVHRAGLLGSVRNIRNPIGLVNVKMGTELKRTLNISVRNPEIIRLVRVGKTGWAGLSPIGLGCSTSFESD